MVGYLTPSASTKEETRNMLLALLNLLHDAGLSFGASHERYVETIRCSSSNFVLAALLDSRALSVPQTLRGLFILWRDQPVRGVFFPLFHALLASPTAAWPARVLVARLVLSEPSSQDAALDAMRAEEFAAQALQFAAGAVLPSLAAADSLPSAGASALAARSEPAGGDRAGVSAVSAGAGERPAAGLQSSSSCVSSPPVLSGAGAAGIEREAIWGASLVEKARVVADGILAACTTGGVNLDSSPTSAANAARDQSAPSSGEGGLAPPPAFAPMHKAIIEALVPIALITHSSAVSPPHATASFPTTAFVSSPSTEGLTGRHVPSVALDSATSRRAPLFSGRFAGPQIHPALPERDRLGALLREECDRAKRSYWQHPDTGDAPLSVTPAHLLQGKFAPAFLHPAPPALPVDADELGWPAAALSPSDVFPASIVDAMRGHFKADAMPSVETAAAAAATAAAPLESPATSPPLSEGVTAASAASLSTSALRHDPASAAAELSGFVAAAPIDRDRISRQLMVRELLQRALRAPLSHMQQEIFLSALGSDPPILWTANFTPATLPLLVEHSPTLALECLQHMRAMAPWATTFQYLAALVHMGISLHGMEVVHRLTMAVPDLPPEFMNLYITNCIASCDSIKDKFMQTRLVRLMCVFLQSTIRSGAVNITDLFVEVQAFCIQFSRIKEASALFRFLKSLDM